MAKFSSKKARRSKAAARATKTLQELAELKPSPRVERVELPVNMTMVVDDLSARDIFAIAALNASSFSGNRSPEDMAKHAYLVADEMLKRRAEP
jgi:hypothetical protein